MLTRDFVQLKPTIWRKRSYCSRMVGEKWWLWIERNWCWHKVCTIPLLLSFKSFFEVFIVQRKTHPCVSQLTQNKCILKIIQNWSMAFMCLGQKKRKWLKMGNHSPFLRHTKFRYIGKNFQNLIVIRRDILKNIN